MLLTKAFISPAPAGASHRSTYRHEDDLFLDCDEAWLHEDALEQDGGQTCNDTELISSQRRIIIDIGKQLGRKLLSGNLNLINITLPVVMFEPRSYLQKLADPWVHPRHLEAAAAAASPLARLQLCVAWFVAGLQHVFASWRKPFNPLLGETWQACTASGSSIFVEQVSHHPPVTAFHLQGPSGLFSFQGLSQPEVSFSAGGLKTNARGYRRITFASDGAVIEISYPYYRICGLLSGQPHGLIKGKATLTDSRHNLTATVIFGPVPGATSRLLARADSFSVCIQGPAAAAAAVIEVPGWVQAAARRAALAAADCAAGMAAAEGDVKAAQQLKEQMEQQQRRDAKVRPAFAHLDCAQSS
ncbi:hypothetical protein OEZ86_012096 [Tetradesmus obliquus]|nr:hypothetical protein OEZ86_012096 [Tetradesmus obliquus]